MQWSWNAAEFSNRLEKTVLARTRSHCCRKTELLLNPFCQPAVILRIPSFCRPSAARINDDKLLQLIPDQKRFNVAIILSGDGKLNRIAAPDALPPTLPASDSEPKHEPDSGGPFQLSIIEPVCRALTHQLF